MRKCMCWLFGHRTTTRDWVVSTGGENPKEIRLQRIRCVRCKHESRNWYFVSVETLKAIQALCKGVSSLGDNS